MRDALKRALVTKMAADANTPAPAKAVAPANAVTPAKHWWARDYPATVPAGKKPVSTAQTRHVVSIPWGASYEK